jgi:predicted nucleic acid-binding protein
MENWVLDTSIVVKWFLQENGTEAAELYLQRLLLGQAFVFVPSLLFYEFGNVLWVHRREDLTVETSLAIWERLKQLPLSVVDWRELFPEAISLAYQHEIAVYDAAFVRLAQIKGCDLITADQKLIQRTADTYSWVKPL